MASLRSLRIRALIGLSLAAASASATAQPVVRCDEPGCNSLDVAITLTGHQPTYWSAATGYAGPDGESVSPFTILDPGLLPGRPALDGTGERVLRGYVLAWAVDANGAEIRWNHLKGDAVIVNYDRGAAWEYVAYTFQVLDPVAHGALSGSPGELHLDGVEYDNGYDLLLLDFYATGAVPPQVSSTFRLETDLTLLPLLIDVRQETDGPVTTKASFTVWNQNETKLTGLDRCVTCWDSALFSQYGPPNHLVIENLQTNKGKAHIDGLASQRCDLDYDPGDECTQASGGPNEDCDPRDVVSVAAPLLGVSVKQLAFTPAARDIVFKYDNAGEHIIGMGTQAGSILADLLGAPPPERPAPTLGDTRERIPLTRVQPGNASGGGYPPPVTLAPNDRASASEKGSLVIYPKVELRWDPTGSQLIQDTFIDLTNDFPGDVFVQMYFVQGDPAFISSGIDANTNGVSDDCEDRLNWSCNINGNQRDATLGTCHLNPNGPFTSLADCELNCEVRYTCTENGVRGDTHCVEDPAGEFATLGECENDCQAHTCRELVRGNGDFVCMTSTDGEFATLAECEEDCGSTAYRCADHYGTIECVEDPNGPYGTLTECQNNCPEYTCAIDVRTPAPVGCMATTNGEYASLAECEDACTIAFACANISGTITCVQDPSGPYATWAECQSNCPQYDCSAAVRDPVQVGCNATTSGEYATLAECEDACTIAFACANISGTITCVQDPSGPYATYAECQSNCPQYNCNLPGRDPTPGCSATTNGEYSTLAECEAECVIRYSCAGTAGCYIDSNGAYATLAECQTACQPYSCGADSGRSTGCYPDAAGAFDSLADCELACQGYQCVSVPGTPNGLGCVPDSINPSYPSLAICEFYCDAVYECDTDGFCVVGTNPQYSEAACASGICPNRVANKKAKK